MGTVVDKEFRVMGLENLAICDGSVFPQMTRLNVQATYVMVGRYCGLLRKQQGR